MVIDDFNSFPFDFRPGRFREFHQFLTRERYSVHSLQPKDTELNGHFRNNHLTVRLFMMDDSIGYGLVRFYDTHWRTRVIIVGDVSLWQELYAWRTATFGAEG